MRPFHFSILLFDMDMHATPTLSVNIDAILTRHMSKCPERSSILHFILHAKEKKSWPFFLNLNILSPQILTRPILRRLHIRVTNLGAAAILELGHLWVHACRPLAGDPSPRIIVCPFRGDDFGRGATFLNPVHQGQHGIVFGVGEARNRVWDGTFEGCLLVGAGEVPRGIVDF